MTTASTDRKPFGRSTATRRKGVLWFLLLAFAGAVSAAVGDAPGFVHACAAYTPDLVTPTSVCRPTAPTTASAPPPNYAAATPTFR